MLVYSIAPCLLFALFILCHLLELAVPGMWAIGWFFFLGFATVLCAYRIQVRGKYEIEGSAVEDFLAGLFYPACALQVRMKNIPLGLFSSHVSLIVGSDYGRPDGHRQEGQRRR